MNAMTSTAALGQLVEPATLRLERLLPGPVERVWSYLVDSDLRARWLASGVMDLTPGASVELVWRNDELTDPPGVAPEGFGGEHRRTSRITAVRAPTLLSFSWGETGEVTFTLEPRGRQVLLTVVHKRLPDDREIRLNICSGWHSHVDLLEARLRDARPAAHWDKWRTLRTEYDRLLPA